MAKWDYSYIGIVEEGTDVAIISRSKSGEDSPQTSINTLSSPHAQPLKVTKQH